MKSQRQSYSLSQDWRAARNPQLIKKVLRLSLVPQCISPGDWFCLCFLNISKCSHSDSHLKTVHVHTSTYFSHNKEAVGSLRNTTLPQKAKLPLSGQWHICSYRKKRVKHSCCLQQEVKVYPKADSIHAVYTLMLSMTSHIAI